ncbi:energy transducer TonB [Trinickia acidisoli]|uniref:energy transducer TonB n=1 Tax=Trinickia acidisoli TaxID=2767482 RepID=UPI002852F142|nr:energy transducer TonB [Trinickia acidisoli]
MHESSVALKLEAGRPAGGSIQVRLIAAPTPQPLAQQVVKPEPKPEPKPKVVEKPVIKPTIRKHAPVLSSTAPSARTTQAPQSEPTKPVEQAPPPPAPVAAAAPTTAPAPAAPGPNLLDTPKQISAGELKQLGCQIPRPEYPAKAKRLEQEGTVVVRLTIGTDGAVKAAHVVQSSGYPLLDDAALASIRAGRCQPYMAGGLPRAVEATQPIAFNLND